MNDRRINFNIDKATTLALWALVTAVGITSWIALGLGHLYLFAGLGFSGCMLSAVAAAAQVRCYALGICGLLRVTAGLEAPDASVHSIR